MTSLADQSEPKHNGSLVEIRTATPAEADAVFALLMDMYAENGLASLAPEKVRQQIERCIGGEAGCVLLAVLGGQIVGTAGIEVQQWWWTNDHHASEMWTYVTPRARRSSAALKLLKAMNEVARVNKVPLAFGVFSPVNTNRKKRLFSRFGREVGAAFIGGASETVFRGL